MLLCRNDPDILVGYELEMLSWGYLFDRADRLGYDLRSRFFAVPFRWRVFHYYFLRTIGNLQLLISRDIVNRTSEMARLFGIQFLEVLSRGSQFRVESIMLRMAKAEGYVALSPTPDQRRRMSAPECIALNMEPESMFCSYPVLVLDFQSLYPSICIAYNYCFSTCLGKLVHSCSHERIDFGCWKLKVPTSTLSKLRQHLVCSPAGVVFVDDTIRRGILPEMLQEILNTRIMVKKCMKEYASNKVILDARQMGLKLIANVTYGYTSANFSGRMPCVEIADSIVQKGRETLEAAIRMVNSHERWNAKVIYGDTDSMFVALPGRDKEEAFKIGAEIAAAVTEVNPYPVKLKFEKVYLPCVLQTKKRYVGYSYESADQREPIFDAKGIETVRRDTFYFCQRVQRKGLPRIGERVPYVIVCGEPRSTLISCVREPWELVRNPNLKLNYVYYVVRQLVPALNRVCNLFNLDCHDLFVQISGRSGASADMCSDCISDPMNSYLTLQCQLRDAERKLSCAIRLCQICSEYTHSPGFPEDGCVSIDCPVYFQRLLICDNFVASAKQFQQLTDVMFSTQ
ncbi:DNA polymerase [Trichuris trichiura]|uniref:DNA polymerase n=1 Tax=Trichuris trichiura TaxID=36087 RepID=A0A077Z1H5_TRITR|nr:DNA polymerase [Trichuris trichiura]